MRGIGSTFSRLPRAAAWLAGAALLAGTLAPKAFAARGFGEAGGAQADETAMAVPRLAPLDSDGVALPRPLAATDAALLRRLFKAAGRVPSLDFSQQAVSLDHAIPLNAAMLGHVLAETYLTPGRHTDAATLAAWLDRYAALPDAAAIAALLHRRDTASSSTPVQPDPAPLSVQSPTPANRAAARRAEAARALFSRNQDRAALSLATRTVEAGHDQAGSAAYVAGLATWRLGHPMAALQHFSAARQAPGAAPEQRAAAAYWAARASIATHDSTRWHRWLAAAAAEPHTFYGQIAARALDRSGGAALATNVLGELDLDAVAAEPAGLRAFALLQLGQTTRAEAELRQLATTLISRADHAPLCRALMLVARRAGLYDLAADLAAQLSPGGDSAAQRNPFPMPRLRPRYGFLIDPALVYGLTRIESNFDTAAVSGMGAQGLMQLMPHTADVLAHGTPRLHDPAINLDLGQRYLTELAGNDAVGGDLIRLLASYNAGPAALARWSADIRDFDDPLLFIEAIPNPETRQFVQHTLAYTWIYAARLHLPTPSLAALAAGRYPRLGGPDLSPIRPIVLH